MKSKSAILIICAVAVLCVAAEFRRPKHEVAILQLVQNSYGYQSNGVWYSGNAGFVVYNVSVSDTNTTISPMSWVYTNGTYVPTSATADGAKAIATLLDQGYRIQNQPNSGGQYDWGQTIMLVK